MSFIEELKRRNVFRVGIAYVLMGWVLLQGADFVLDLIGAPDWVIRAMAVAAAVGLPVALFFAWAFEVTPEGIKREEEIDRSHSIAPQTGRKLDKAIIVFLAAALVLVLGDRFLLTDGSAPAPVSSPVAEAGPAEDIADSSSPLTVAVLPFRNMSSGAEDGYFADGLTEEILNSLAQLPELQVTARTSSFFFKDKDLPVPEIAAQLGVDHLVEGSVRRGGEQVRITAQLVRASDGFHLWSRTYDRTLEDVFLVQEEIATQIAETLNVVLDQDKLDLMQRSGIGDINAFIAFQKGRDLFVQAHDADSGIDIEEGLAPAVPYFRQATAVSPGLIAAWIYLADASAHKLFNAATGRSGTSEEDAERALATLRADLGEAWEQAAPGLQKDILDVERSLFLDDWTGMNEKLERAMGSGNCPRSNWTTEFATTMYSPEAVLRQNAEQLQCDPLNELIVFNHAYAMLWAGKAEDAIRTSREAQERGVTFGWLESVEFAGHLALGEMDKAVASGNEPSGWLGIDRNVIHAAAAGDEERVMSLAAQARSREDHGDWKELLLSAVIGDRETANAAAARIDARPGGHLALNNAAFACLCGSPFELEAVPNFARRLAAAGIVWSPYTVIHFPMKDW